MELGVGIRYAEALILRQSRSEVVVMSVSTFLRADDIGVLRADHLQAVVLPVVPAVPRLAVRRHINSDIAA